MDDRVKQAFWGGFLTSIIGLPPALLTENLYLLLVFGFIGFSLGYCYHIIAEKTSYAIDIISKQGVGQAVKNDSLVKVWLRHLGKRIKKLYHLIDRTIVIIAYPFLNLPKALRISYQWLILAAVCTIEHAKDAPGRFSEWIDFEINKIFMDNLISVITSTCIVFLTSLALITSSLAGNPKDPTDPTGTILISFLLAGLSLIANIDKITFLWFIKKESSYFAKYKRNKRFYFLYTLLECTWLGSWAALLGYIGFFYFFITMAVIMASIFIYFPLLFLIKMSWTAIIWNNKTGLPSFIVAITTAWLFYDLIISHELSILIQGVLIIVSGVTGGLLTATFCHLTEKIFVTKPDWCDQPYFDSECCDNGILEKGIKDIGTSVIRVSSLIWNTVLFVTPTKNRKNWQIKNANKLVFNL
ncbi:hypothetical protein C0583_02675 [Candidatus Parcubacteria bacterium]|nr:MAG: hypothetical protein C0583_02675 [Candidatus Parcubacteria bacterium]